MRHRRTLTGFETAAALYHKVNLAAGMKHTRLFAALGVISVLPAIVLICLGITGSTVPRILDSPFAIMPGLALAAVLNLIAVIRVRPERIETGDISGLCVRIGAQPANLAVLALSAAITVLIAGYLFVENFQAR
jgi:hypothetical protein